MLRYSARVLPLPALVAGTLGAATLLGLVHLRPSLMLQAAGIAAAAVAATASGLFDEPAAALVDTLPRPLWWRTVARLAPAAVLAVLWVAGAAMVDSQGVGRPDVLRLQGLGAILLGVAASVWLRRRGHATPGATVARTLLLAVLFLVTVNPFDRALPLFPFGALGDWEASRRLWTVLVVAGAAALTVGCLERGWRPRVRRRGRSSRTAQGAAAAVTYRLRSRSRRDVEAR